MILYNSISLSWSISLSLFTSTVPALIRKLPPPELISVIFPGFPRHHPPHSSCATSRCPPVRARRETRGPPWRLRQKGRSSGPWETTGARVGWFWAGNEWIFEETPLLGRNDGGMMSSTEKKRGTLRNNTPVPRLARRVIIGMDDSLKKMLRGVVSLPSSITQWANRNTHLQFTSSSS